MTLEVIDKYRVSSMQVGKISEVVSHRMSTHNHSPFMHLDWWSIENQL